jgi:hypothetical protein
MPRVKGSKNKPKEKEVVDPILVDEDLVHAEPKPTKEKVLIGYHPISGAEVWQ